MLHRVWLASCAWVPSLLQLPLPLLLLHELLLHLPQHPLLLPPLLLLLLLLLLPRVVAAAGVASASVAHALLVPALARLYSLLVAMLQLLQLLLLVVVLLLFFLLLLRGLLLHHVPFRGSELTGSMGKLTLARLAGALALLESSAQRRFAKVRCRVQLGLAVCVRAAGASNAASGDVAAPLGLVELRVEPVQVHGPQPVGPGVHRPRVAAVRSAVACPAAGVLEELSPALAHHHHSKLGGWRWWWIVRRGADADAATPVVVGARLILGRRDDAAANDGGVPPLVS
mmetsp:Transcript_147424/g.367543  ORF Transcript_147424/g.367543 Transcript_147424/m.367543 type:complete len:285 (-) Transcript_147424:248-1102(-)